MLSIYLDTNVYITGLLQSKTNSARILEEMTEGAIRVIQSDYLFDEVLAWFKQHKGKNIVGGVRNYLLSIPIRESVHRPEWGVFVEKLKDKVKDIDDLPHICSYIAGSCDYFITTNRKLTQEAVREIVNFKSPKEFIEDVLHKKGIETEFGV
ncbi:MAG: PIN domain-containing protein [Thermoplasmata archaeon]